MKQQATNEDKAAGFTNSEHSFLETKDLLPHEAQHGAHEQHQAL